MNGIVYFFKARHRLHFAPTGGIPDVAVVASLM